MLQEHKDYIEKMIFEVFGDKKLYSEKKIFINTSANYLSDIKVFSLENTSKKIAKLIHEFLVLHRLS